MDTKMCNKCDSEKPINEMLTLYGKPRPLCKACNRIQMRAYYTANKSTYKADVLTRKWKLRYNALEYVKAHVKLHGGCSECNETDFVVMDFDHIDRTTKKYNISQMVSVGYGVNTIQKELDKCRILCSNCHRRHTAVQMGWYENIYKKVGEQ